MSPIIPSQPSATGVAPKQLPLLDRNAPQCDASFASAGPSNYWRSIEQLVGSSEVEEYLNAEFPRLSQAIEGLDRRHFMRLLGASVALVGLTSTGCRRWPVDEIRPHTSRPVGSTPGVAEYYATLFEWNGASNGILAKSFDGRPIKVEGNPEHPMSHGASSGLAQASVLDLYDPDRSRTVLQRIDSDQVKRTWDEFQAYAQALFGSHRARQGDGLAILLQPDSSPTQRRLIDELKSSMPKARWFVYRPLHDDNAWQGSRSAFGQTVRCQYDLTKASTIVCFDADLLGSHPAQLKSARDWAAGRRSADQGVMNRLVCAESGWSLTGSVADDRIPMRPSQFELAVQWIAARLGIDSEFPQGLGAALEQRLDAVAQGLLNAGKSALVVAGASISPKSHHLVHVINDQLGSVGTCVSYSAEPLADITPAGSVRSIQQLSELLQGNVVQTLVIINGNPIYDAPADASLDLRSTSNRPLVSIHLSSHNNETSQACTWHLPAAHALESWSDGLAWDGTYTLGQPLIMPLYEGRSSLEFLSLIAGRPKEDIRSLIQETFARRFPNAGPKGWEVALHDGFQADSQFPSVAVAKPALPAKVAVRSANETGTAGDPRLVRRANGDNLRIHVDAVDKAIASDLDSAPSSPSDFEIQFIADSKAYDGRFANNAWLQELPDPLTKLTWDNAALISKADADRLSLKNGDVIRIDGEPSANGKNASIEIPVLIMPGQAVGCITVPLGYGRTQAGRIGNEVGVSAYPLRTCKQSYVALNCELTKTGRHHMLATTQLHHLVESIADVALRKRLGEKGEPGLLVHETSLAEYRRDHHAVHGESHPVHQAPLFNQPASFADPHRWAMAIDLNACIGCSGCVVACQAENNIPVVGAANVARNREMHWLRIDRYFKGDIAEPDMVHVPTACAHCENAPCEQVCPVAATVHDSEGLNVMVYNRCIGTRYCANNCPYKVRRFNYFDYQASDPREPAKPWLGIPDQQSVVDISTLKSMVHNPEVTVRMRGVMEKCTYCVQRIADARITSKNEFAQGLRDSDLVREGEVQTACQATCPTQAIVFGDLNDPDSAVSKARNNVRSYEMLADLNLGARTTYLAKIRNRDT